MKEIIRERTLAEAEYILQTGATVRDAAKKLDVSKSTVHKDVTHRLKSIDPVLYANIKAVLDFNLSERHIRGGEATKKKYERRK